MSCKSELLLFCLCLSVPGCTTKLDLGGTSSEEALGPDDVVGVVLGRFDYPAASLQVQAGGTLTRTDAQGRFVVRNAPTRYDVALNRGNASHPFVTQYIGLTTRRPILRLDTGDTSSAAIQMAYPPPTVADTRHVDLGYHADIGTINLSPGPLAGRPGPNWFPLPAGATSADVVVGSLTFLAAAESRPSAFLGYDQATLHLSSGAVATWTPAYRPVDAMSVTGSVAVEDPRQQAYEAYLYVSLAPGGAWAGLNLDAVENQQPWSFLVPKIPGAAWAIEYHAYDIGRAGSGGGAEAHGWALVGEDGTVPAVSLRPPPRPVAPADNATGFGVGSTLAWTGEGVCTVSLQTAGMGDQAILQPSFSFVTDQGTLTMPDTSAFGIALPALETYSWGVACTQSSKPPLAGDPVLLAEDPLASGGNMEIGHTFVTR
jgi:hypothetical protein